MVNNTFKVINITAVPLSVALWRVLKLHPKPIQMRTSGMSIKLQIYFKIKLLWEEQVQSHYSKVASRPKYPMFV